VAAGSWAEAEHSRKDCDFLSVEDGQRTATADGSGDRESPHFDTNRDVFTVRREWSVRVFVLRDTAGPEERGRFTFISSPLLPGKGEAIELSGRPYEVAYRKFKLCSFEGAAQIVVDLYVLGRESFGGGELESSSSPAPLS
jgi:hypothetical protein